MSNPTKLVAGIIALTGFVVAAIAGLGAGNAAETTLLRCIITMFVCYFAGLPLGMVCEHVINEHLKEFMSKNPVPLAALVEADGADSAVKAEANVEEEVLIV